MSGFEIDNNSGDIRYDGYEYVSTKIKLKTYAISAETNPTPNTVDLRLSDSDGYIDNVVFVGGSNMTVVRNNANTITLSSTAQGNDTNTTYQISAETSPIQNAAKLRLSGSDGYTDDVTFAGGSGLSVVRTDENTLTLNSTQNYFSNVVVDGYTLAAEVQSDTLNVVAGTGIKLTADTNTDSFTIENSGVTGITAGLGINTTANLGNITVINTGVRTFNGANGAVTYNSFGTVSDGNNTAVADQANDTILLVSGTGIGITVNSGADSATFTNTGVTQFNGGTGNISYNSFGTMSDGTNTAVADQGNDTFTFIGGSGVGVLVNAPGDNLTISNTGVTQAIAGTGISVSAGTGNVTIGNTGVTAITPGTGIVTSGSGNVTVTNDGVTTFNGAKGAIIYDNFLKYTDGVNTATPDGASDTFTFSGGTGISAVINAGTDTLTIALKESSIVISPSITINTGTTSPVFVISNVPANNAFEFTISIMIKFVASGANNSYDVLLGTNGTFTNAAASVIFGPSTLSEITSNVTATTSSVLNDANVHALNIVGVVHNGGTTANIAFSIKNNSGVNNLSVLAKSRMKYNFI